MENYNRLQLVYEHLITLQWTCKGMIGDKKQYDVYEEMINQTRQLQLLEKKQ